MEVPAHVHLDALLQQGDAAPAPDERLGLHNYFALEDSQVGEVDEIFCKPYTQKQGMNHPVVLRDGS